MRTLRGKTFAIFLVMLLASGAVIYVVSRITLLGSFADLEEQGVQRDVERALNVLSDELSRLSGATRDWAAWDDTYAFIEDGNEAFVASNIHDLAFISNHLSAMLFVHSSGRVVLGKAFDLNQKRPMPLPSGFQEDAFLKDILARVHGPADKGGFETRPYGLIRLPEGPMLIAVQPILTSLGEGPVRGALVWGRFLDGAEVDSLAAASRLYLAVRPLDDPRLPSDYRAAVSAISDQTPIVAQPLNGATTAGYALLRDIYGKPALVLRADIPRDLYQHGEATVLYFMGALLLVGVLFVALTLLLLDRVALSRLSRLSGEVSAIGASGDLSRRARVSGRDEISRLAAGINAMLQEVEQSQAQRSRAEEALRESEERTRLTLDAALDAVVMMDSEGVITGWNPQAEAVFGWPRDEALGRPLADTIIPSQYREAHRRGLERFLATGEGPVLNRRIEMAALHRDGHELPVELTILPLKLEGAYQFSAFVRDITERKQSEFMVNQAAAEVRLLYSIAAATSDTESFEHALQQCLDLVCEYLGWPVGHLYMLASDDTGELVPTSIWHVDDAQTFEPFRQETERTRLAPGVGLPGRIMSSGEPEWIADLWADANFPRINAAREVGLRAGFGLPVKLGPVTVAVLEFFATESRPPDQRLIELMRSVGAQIGRVPERMQAQKTLRSALELAQSAYRAKSNFLARVSNEVRTSLGGITVAVELLQDTQLTEEQREYLEMMRNAADSLMEAVNINMPAQAASDAT
jgi:PAS domain S-box-containing protein